MWVCACVDGFVHVSITYILQLCTWFSEVVSFRVFEVSFGAEFRGGVSEHGPGQFWMDQDRSVSGPGLQESD